MRFKSKGPQIKTAVYCDNIFEVQNFVTDMKEKAQAGKMILYWSGMGG